MNIKNAFITASRALAKNRMRSALTSFGIIIGVSSVIVMVGMGNSARVAVREKVYTYGANAIAIWLPRNKLFTMTDYENLKKIMPQIKFFSPVFRMRNVTTKYKNKKMKAFMYGVNNDYLYMRDRFIESGRLFSESEVDSIAKVAIIGKTNVKELFDGESPIGEQILVGETPVTVIGVLNEAGQAFTGDDFDNTIIIPYSTARVRMFNLNGFEEIYIATHKPEEVNETSADIRNYLRKKHNILEGVPDEFRISKSEDRLKMADDISNALAILLAGIASISLFVGGVGIMNIMLVSVTERTREIGIRMAIGAKKKDIMMQFLIESVTLSSLGGVIGITLGLIIYYAIVQVVQWPFIFSFMSVIVSVLFAAGVGIFFGYYPSKKAASLKPIEALKYE